jgi:hypothetical protein
VREDQRVILVFKVLKESKVQLDRREILDLKVSKAKEDLKVSKVSKVQLVSKAIRAIRAIRVKKVIVGIKVQSDQREISG